MRWLHNNSHLVARNKKSKEIKINSKNSKYLNCDQRKALKVHKTIHYFHSNVKIFN